MGIPGDMMPAKTKCEIVRIHSATRSAKPWGTSTFRHKLTSIGEGLASNVGLVDWAL